MAQPMSTHGTQWGIVGLRPWNGAPRPLPQSFGILLHRWLLGIPMETRGRDFQRSPGWSLTEKGKKKLFRNMVFSKTTACSLHVQPCLVAIGGWRLVEIAGWRLAVGGGWQLVMGGWWRLAAVDGWRLVAVGG